MSYNTWFTETAEILKSVPGGAELLKWFGDEPNFGHGEVLELSLDTSGNSRLRVVAFSFAGARDNSEGTPRSVVTFDLANMIDISVEGFSAPNIIGGLKLRYAREKNFHPSLLGVGMSASDHEIELVPCAGVFGTIRATVVSVSFERLPPQELIE